MARAIEVRWGKFLPHVTQSNHFQTSLNWCFLTSFEPFQNNLLLRPSQFFSLFLIGWTLQNLPSLPEKTNEGPRKKKPTPKVFLRCSPLFQLWKRMSFYSEHFIIRQSTAFNCLLYYFNCYPCKNNLINLSKRASVSHKN